MKSSGGPAGPSPCFSRLKSEIDETSTSWGPSAPHTAPPSASLGTRRTAPAPPLLRRDEALKHGRIWEKAPHKGKFEKKNWTLLGILLRFPLSVNALHSRAYTHTLTKVRTSSSQLGAAPGVVRPPARTPDYLLGLNPAPPPSLTPHALWNLLMADRRLRSTRSPAAQLARREGSEGRVQARPLVLRRPHRRGQGPSAGTRRTPSRLLFVLGCSWQRAQQCAAVRSRDPQDEWNRQLGVGRVPCTKQKYGINIMGFVCIVRETKTKQKKRR